MANIPKNAIGERQYIIQEHDSILVQSFKFGVLPIIGLSAAYFLINYFYKEGDSEAADTKNTKYAEINVCNNEWREYFVINQVCEKHFKILKKDNEERIKRLQTQLERVKVREKELHHKVEESAHHRAILSELKEDKKKIENELKRIEILRQKNECNMKDKKEMSDDANSNNVINRNIRKAYDEEHALTLKGRKEYIAECSLVKIHDNRAQYLESQISKALSQYEAMSNEAEKLPVLSCKKNSLTESFAVSQLFKKEVAITQQCNEEALHDKYNRIKYVLLELSEDEKAEVCLYYNEAIGEVIKNGENLNDITFD
ncbi:hypothetical protein Fsol_00429 [Candidatus Fokinia solitaria]|uniref:Uncharacterized protein n=1 Tax=Candidatus Fokinia solitaria TaxID=1802984 RepID=A0A2U8BS93_9RICK|nr:hypothetical protein [Candidatus Fokinia solitaria]AWD33224.1 hypothetical protein Fsol_00429 [Candidatus Fokinia solitaria]